ncbi:MAG: adenylate/guanylate cyclase domain-containing protein [Gemmatimonadota bacterium]|nr:MAG: adenylate/guanylate cyclase domain-containing protein [Gemmatimonadota bacterium]
MGAAATDEILVMALAHVTRFAYACEGRSNAEVFDTLSGYYRVAEQFASMAGGRVVKYMGDGVLFAFPEGAARNAVRALQEFQSAASELWHDFDSTCGVEVNVHVGRVAAGDIGHGSDRRFDIVGKAVNELSRMPWDGLHLSPELRALLDA